MMTLKSPALDTSKKFQHIRFLGAEGIGMSALIRILEYQIKNAICNPNMKISKSDLAYEQNDPLDEDIDLVVRSTAIKETDPDFVELKKRGVEIWHRRDMLNFLSLPFKQVVVTGTHGKTTCSAMLAHIFVEAAKENPEIDPSFAVGGILANYNANGKAGSGKYFILEGDESDKSFTVTQPHLALVTCIEADHLENYPGGLEEIKKCFFDFLDRAPVRVINIDDPHLAEYAAQNDCITYSEKELDSLKIDLALPGKYNKSNALACIKAAEALGVNKETAIKALESFTGIKRRFELVNANYNGIKVYDDYAHHPTEVKVFLDACLSLEPKKMLFVYQLHHPERTQQFWNDFVEVFKTFPTGHKMLLADIYVARSKHIDGVESEKMVNDIGLENVSYLAPLETGTTSQGNFNDMVAALKPQIDKELESGDYSHLFVVGAGNIAKVAAAFSSQ